MNETQAFQELLNANYKQLIIALVGIMVAMVVIKKFWDEFLNIFHIDTPTRKKEKERKEEMAQFNERLNEIQQQQKETKEFEKQLEAKIDKIETLLNKHVMASMRSTLWRIHHEATSQGYITKEGLKTFIECGNVYESSGGDDIYHEKLYPDVMNLELKS